MIGRSEERSASEQSFSEFYSAQLPRLRRFLARRIDSKETREDLETVIMTIAWRRFDDAPTDAVSFGWLAGIAGGAVTNERRSERRRRALIERITRNSGAIVDHRDVIEELEPRVRAALVQLGADDLEMLLLHEWDECTYAELAAAFDLNEAAARKRLSRARQRFAAHYNSYAVLDGGPANAS